MNSMKKLLSALMTMVLVFVSVVFFVPKTSAKTISSLKDEQSKIQEKINESEKKLKELQGQIDAQEKIVSELNKQLSNLSDEYENVLYQKSVVNDEILKTEKKIEALNAKIAQKDAEIQATIDLFCKRLRANYIAGGSSTLEMLANSSSVSVFFNRLEMMKRVTDNDQALVDELNREIKELEAAKAELNAEKEKLVKKQNELHKVETDLDQTMQTIKSKQAEVDRRLAQLEGAATDLHHDIKEFDEQEAKIKAEINKIYAQQAAAAAAANKKPSGNVYYNTAPNPATGFAFPVQYSGCYLSSGFGYRSASISGNAFHGGIDITGGSIYGKPVTASRSGTVIIAEHYSNRGYGHYVMLDHGDGYQTLYGHCSSVVVNAGDHVKQGQVIAYVGSTGNSTGPHLHFEVRYQGEKKNPLNYVSF